MGYLLLTGQHIFEGATVIEICSHHLHTPPVPPSERLGHLVPRELEAWILSCVEKDPARRPPTATAAAAALERCSVGDGWTPDRAREWWEKRGRALRDARVGGGEPSGATLTLPLERIASP